ncbi:Rieske 2Fe-2S domain-containing protein [Nocardioides aquiterrae]|uniref:Aromatic ring-hydroxylating dioxygenase subunit alpha n=1 Tax=Nocardioides aquiterrae TaxID=203799 RepID=A0ABP4EXR1_9ACTN
MGIPRHAWYPVAASEGIGRSPIARRLVEVPLVLYRSTTGEPVALEDRCAHRPVRLSDGVLDGDLIRSTYTGFTYDPTGRCVSVPTQEQVPYGAAVRSFPARDDGSFVWVWIGEAGLAALRTPPDTSVLRTDGWTTFGGALDTAAGIGLLYDNFCDITHVVQLDQAIAPPALTTGPPPPLEVEVSETSVRFWRRFDAAPLAPWNAQVLDLPEDAEHEQVEEGEFVGPGYWVDRWTVEVKGHGDHDGQHTLVFSHALTPVSEKRTRHIWRVSRNFAGSAAAEGTLKPLFEAYYARVGEVLEQMQTILDEEGPRPEVAVAADAAVTHVRRIMQRMVAEELGG